VGPKKLARGGSFAKWKPVKRFFHAKGLKQHYFKQHNIIIGKYDASPYTYDDS